METEPYGVPDEAASRTRLQRVVGDTYVVGGLLGRGGFAEVFEAEDPRLLRKVAIKVVRPELTQPDLAERFLREARAIARLRHPHVVEVYAVGASDEVPHFIMPRIEGETLAERVRRVGPLPVDEARRILIEAARGLAAAHRAGVVHRDVKPENLLLEGEEARVLITDFGIATAVAGVGGDATLTAAGTWVGSPGYSSPEHVAGDAVDARADLYSLGVVAYEMLVGRPPFTADSAQSLIAKHLTEAPAPVGTQRPDCPDGLAAAVDRCLEKDPRRRFQNSRELLDALEEETPAAPAPAVADAAQRGERSVVRSPLTGIRRGLVGSGALVAVAAVADLLQGEALAWTAPALLVAGTFTVAAWGALRRLGYEVPDLWRRRPEGPGPFATTTQENFGAYDATVRACGARRAAILAAFNRISRVEQARHPDLRATVDEIVSHVKRLARRLAALDAREGALAPGGSGRRAVLTPVAAERERVRRATFERELEEARAATEQDLTEAILALETIHDWLALPSGVDSETVRQELAEAVQRAKETVRRRQDAP